jgi:hypothetical protein
MILARSEGGSEELSSYLALGEYDEYCRNRSWWCPVSPTGSHHWLIEVSGWGKCKYCRKERGFAREVYGNSECKWDFGETQVAQHEETPHEETPHVGSSSLGYGFY